MLNILSYSKHCRWIIVKVSFLIIFWPNLLMAQTVRDSTESIGLEGKYLQLTPNTANDAWDLQAHFTVNVPANVSELAKSAPLYFVFDWAVKHSRWYWYDERLAKGRLYWRLSHNALTQKWRVSTANSSAMSEARFALTFNTLQEALANLRHIRRDKIVKANYLYPNETYDVSARLYLDTSLLPKPFQLNAMRDTDWTLDSGLMQTTLKIIPSILPNVRK
jgi:Domain of unknown function (DUF4390)